MDRVGCRRLWTGPGGLVDNAVIHFDTRGNIREIESRPSPEGLSHPFGMPAFFDAHCHFSWMILKEISLDLSGAGSAGEMLDMISLGLSEFQGDIFRCESYDESRWENPELPTLAELDAVTGERPCFLCRVCGHAGMANSAMLAMMHPEDPAFVDPATGRLLERPVMEFSRRFPPDPASVVRGMAAVTGRIHAAGVTGICSMEKPAEARAIADASLPLDITFALRDSAPSRVAGSGLPGGMLKLFLDGSFGAGNAATDPSSDANLLLDDRELLQILLDSGEAGVVPVIHAIGAAALSQLARVSALAFRSLGGGFPIRVEHGEDLPEVLSGPWDPEFHIFSMQPNFVERWQRPGGMYHRLLSPERAAGLNPFRSVLDRGFRLGFGSDSMPFGPLYGLRGALSHPSPAQSLTTEEALGAYTLDAAGISSCGPLSLPLAPGRPGDLVFLSSDPFQGLEGVAVERTLRRGEEVFRMENS